MHAGPSTFHANRYNCNLLMPDPLSLFIVTPSFNTGRYIGDAIRSVFRQDWPAMDYLVMDGGSTDNTLDVLRGFGERLRWVSKPDGGQAAALRDAFARSRADVFAWLNADDVYTDDALRVAMDFLAAHPEVDVVYGDADYINADGDLISRCTHIEPYSAHRLLHYSDFIVQPATFFRRCAYEAAGGIDVSLHFAMDYDLWVKMARLSVAYVPHLLAHYRWLTDNKTAIGGIHRLNEITRMMAAHGYGEPAYVRLERVNYHAQQAMGALKHGRLGGMAIEAAQAARALFSDPRALLSMAQPRTWRIIWTGQVLRNRAARLAAQRHAMQNKVEAVVR